MRCDLCVSIWYTDQNRQKKFGGNVSKAYELPFSPPVGMKIECPAWKSNENHRVEEVTLCFDVDTDEPMLSVFMGQDIMDSPEWVDSRIEMYERWGWECTYRDPAIPKREGRFQPSARR